MNMMNDVLSDYLDDFVLVFLDDVLVYSCIVEINTEHLGKSWKFFIDIAYMQRRTNVASWRKKSSSLDSGLRYKGLLLLKHKMKAIVEWEVPQDLKGLGHSWGLPNAIAALYKNTQSWHPH